MVKKTTPRKYQANKVYCAKCKKYHDSRSDIAKKHYNYINLYK